MSNHLKGLLITALGVIFVIPDALFVRLIEADAMVIAFWRGLTSGTIILLAVMLTRQFGSFRAVLTTGWPAAIYIGLIGLTTAGFVLAISNTSVANAVFIFATLPIFAAVFSRVFLGEPFSRRILATMVVVMLGLGVIAYGSTDSSVAHWSGDLWALFVSAAYAAALTSLRKVRDTQMIPAIPIAYIGAACVIGLFVDPWEIFATQWPYLLGHGVFIATATCLLTLGPRYISSAEVSLLILLESVFAPLLVWVVIGEDPGRWTLVGGVIVVGALCVSNLIALRRS